MDVVSRTDCWLSRSLLFFYHYIWSSHLSLKNSHYFYHEGETGGRLFTHHSRRKSKPFSYMMFGTWDTSIFINMQTSAQEIELNYPYARIPCRKFMYFGKTRPKKGRKEFHRVNEREIEMIFAYQKKTNDKKFPLSLLVYEIPVWKIIVKKLSRTFFFNSTRIRLLSFSSFDDRMKALNLAAFFEVSGDFNTYFLVVFKTSYVVSWYKCGDCQLSLEKCKPFS